MRTTSLMLPLVLGCAAGCVGPADLTSVAAAQPPSDPESPPGPSAAAAPAPVLTLAHRAADGRVFAELPGDAPGDRHERAQPLCGPPECDFQLFAHRRSDPPGGEVVILRPDGTTCAGRLAGRVDLGVIDPFQVPRPRLPAAADWRRAALVRGCRGTDEPFLIAVHGATPTVGLLTERDAAAERAARRAPGSRRGRLATVWRFGGRHWVRVVEPGQWDDVFYVFDADGRTRLEPERVSEHDEMCCNLVTGLVDLDGDGRPEVITRDGYPEDAAWVHVRVNGGLSWSAELAWGSY